MTTLALLGTTLGFAFAAGLNLYATILVIGLAQRLRLDRCRRRRSRACGCWRTRWCSARRP